jgi:hypothetical protein
MADGPVLADPPGGQWNDKDNEYPEASGGRNWNPYGARGGASAVPQPKNYSTRKGGFALAKLPGE